MAVLEGLGAIAGNFAEGYRQARAQKTQQSMQQQQLDYEHANRLFQMADQVQDPHMKDTLFSSATRILESLESPTKTKSNPKGIGAMFGSMFGIGHQKDTPAPSVSETPMGPAKPMESVAPGAVSPDSQTFGSFGNMFGAELNAKPTAEAAPVPQGPQLPKVPELDLSGVPPTRELIQSGMPFPKPSITDPRGTPVAAPPATGPAEVAPPPTAARHPQSGQPLNLPSPIDITKKAMEATQSPKYGFRDPVRQKMAEQQMASQVMDTLLKVTDQHLAQNPHIKTIAAADNDPDFGPEFRQVMDAIGRFEAAGQIEKGTLENWQKQRFDDVRFGAEKYNPDKNVQVERDPFGNPMQRDKDGNWTRIPGVGEKTAPEKTLKELADAAFVKMPTQRTQSDINAINGFKEAFKSEQASKGTPTDRVQDMWLDDKRNTEGKTSDQISSAFQARFHPLQPVVTSLPGVNPASGETEIFILNHTSGKMESTKIKTPGPTFIPERYQVSGTMQVPTKVGNRTIMESVPTKLFSADQLIAGNSSGDVTLDTLTNLLNAGAQFSTEDAAKLRRYIASKANPYAAPAR